MKNDIEKSLADNEYTQLKKNTVNAKGQLTDSKSVRFYGADNKGVRVMFVGNSITLHGVLKEIGWNNEWGMAASSADNDYVHILMEKVRKLDPQAAFCIWNSHAHGSVCFGRRQAEPGNVELTC